MFAYCIQECLFNRQASALMWQDQSYALLLDALKRGVEPRCRDHIAEQCVKENDYCLARTCCTWFGKICTSEGFNKDEQHAGTLLPRLSAEWKHHRGRAWVIAQEPVHTGWDSTNIAIELLHHLEPLECDCSPQGQSAWVGLYLCILLGFHFFFKMF